MRPRLRGRKGLILLPALLPQPDSQEVRGRRADATPSPGRSPEGHLAARTLPELARTYDAPAVAWILLPQVRQLPSRDSRAERLAVVRRRAGCGSDGATLNSASAPPGQKACSMPPSRSVPSVMPASIPNPLVAGYARSRPGRRAASRNDDVARRGLHRPAASPQGSPSSGLPPQAASTRAS
jgi:hypothetical protein